MFIIKVGGGKNIKWDYIAQDLKKIKEEVVIVHGANAWMEEIGSKLGISEKMIVSPSGYISRYTDNRTMEILTMVYCGLINKKIIAYMQKHGINAIGLSGADGRLWLGKRKEVILSQEGDKTKIIRDSATGNVESVNAELLQLLIHAGYIPVITIPAITKAGDLINVDNDRAVAIMIRDLKIKKVVVLFEAPGLLDDPMDENSKISVIRYNKLDTYIRKTSGRMKKKLLGAKEAFSFGVKTIYFGDGRIPLPISSALKGKGTVIY